MASTRACPNTALASSRLIPVPACPRRALSPAVSKRRGGRRSLLFVPGPDLLKRAPPPSVSTFSVASVRGVQPLASGRAPGAWRPSPSAPCPAPLSPRGLFLESAAHALRAHPLARLRVCGRAFFPRARLRLHRASESAACPRPHARYRDCGKAAFRRARLRPHRAYWETQFTRTLTVPGLRTAASLDACLHPRRASGNAVPPNPHRFHGYGRAASSGRPPALSSRFWKRGSRGTSRLLHGYGTAASRDARPHPPSRLWKRGSRGPSPAPRLWNGGLSGRLPAPSSRLWKRGSAEPSPVPRLRKGGLSGRAPALSSRLWKRNSPEPSPAPRLRNGGLSGRPPALSSRLWKRNSPAHHRLHGCGTAASRDARPHPRQLHGYGKAASPCALPHLRYAVRNAAYVHPRARLRGCGTGASPGRSPERSPAPSPRF